MNELVSKAVDEIRIRFVPDELALEDDGQGGVRIRFGPVGLGLPYTQTETWVAGHIPAQIPYADIYPVFVRGDLARRDGAALTAPVTPGHSFMGQGAVQVSLRSNARDPAVETPALKFLKVIDWLKSR